MKLFTKFLCISLICLSSVGSVRADNHPVASQWKDIQSWKNFGPHFKGGLDKDGKLIAIYDLAYPSAKEKILIGIIDTASAAYSKVVDLLQQAQKIFFGNALTIASDDPSAVSAKQVQDAIKALKTLQSQKAAREAGRLTVLGNMKAQSTDDNWWRNVAWKSADLAKGDKAPEHFNISDIDFARMSGKLQISSETALNSPLKDIEFVKKSEDSYEFYWTRTGALSQEPPFKIADLVCTTCGFDENIKKGSMRSNIASALTNIPVPYLAGVLTAALGEFYLFQDELLFNHQQMLLEFVKESEENAPMLSALNTMSASERDAIVNYVMLARTDEAGAKQWIENKPIDKWNDDEKDLLTRAQSSLDYLHEHAYRVTLLSPRFALASDESSGPDIFNLSAPRYWNLLSPFVAFDNNSPHMQRNGRIVIETAHTLVQFLNVFVPYAIVGSAVTKAFDYMLETPMHTIQHLEARLLSNLYTRSSTETDWDFQINMIQQQQINPLELFSSDTNALVTARKATYKIP